jgi:hypothetical protein
MQKIKWNVKCVLFTNDYLGYQPKKDAMGSICSMQEIDQEMWLLLENMRETKSEKWHWWE